MTADETRDQSENTPERVDRMAQAIWLEELPERNRQWGEVVWGAPNFQEDKARERAIRQARAALRAAGLLVEDTPADERVERALSAYAIHSGCRGDEFREYVCPECGHLYATVEDRKAGLDADALYEAGHRHRMTMALTAAGVAPQETERVNGLDVHDWAKIARAKDEANEAAIAAIEDLAHAIRLTVEYVGNDWLPPAEGWSWFDALMRHRPELAQPFVESPILLRPQGEPAGIVSPALSETAQRIKREWLATHEGFEDLYSAEFDRMLAGVAPPASGAGPEPGPWFAWLARAVREHLNSLRGGNRG